MLVAVVLAAQPHLILTVWQTRQTVAWTTAAPPSPAALSLVSKPEPDQWAIYPPVGKLSVHTARVKPQSMSDQTEDIVVFEWILFFPPPWFDQSERG